MLLHEFRELRLHNQKAKKKMSLPSPLLPPTPLFVSTFSLSRFLSRHGHTSWSRQTRPGDFMCALRCFDYQGITRDSIEALFRLYQGSIKALLRLYYGSVRVCSVYQGITRDYAWRFHTCLCSRPPNPWCPQPTHTHSYRVSIKALLRLY
jgi:hypothetical protein